jgi:hypothetical protein
MELLACFNIIAPEFIDKLSEEQILGYLYLASEQVTIGNIKESVKNMMIAYLAAHIADIALRSAQASGAVSSITEGKLSIAYNTVKAVDSLSTTKYGLEYKALCRKYITYIPQTIWI